MNKKRAEDYIYFSAFAATVVLFFLLPSHANTQFDYYLNDFIDKYLLGNGYYSPPDYPFSAKVTNSFSVIFGVIGGTFIGIWRKDGVKYVSKSVWIGCLIMLALGIGSFFLSLNPQEFRESTLRRSFGTSESFHNNPFLFLLMMLAKQGCIYMGIRGPLTLLLHYVDKIRK